MCAYLRDFLSSKNNPVSFTLLTQASPDQKGKRKHRGRQDTVASKSQPARNFFVTDRGDEGVARIMDQTNGLGADSVLECVGTQESMVQAIHAARPGGYVSYVGVLSCVRASSLVPS
jgi:Zn-dependent alcohol dehydrogenase